ncbi:MAG: phage holin family protein [Pseudonocardia sp.]
MASPTSSSGTAVPPVLPSIPLAPEPAQAAGDQSIGALVREVTEHVSTLVRSEVELARAELTSEVKKGVRGSIYFVIALTILLFSLFFFFFFLGELLHVWLARWAAFGIVFLLMIVTAGAFGLLGYRRVRKIRKPERTITTLKASAAVLGSRGRESAAARRGLAGGYSNGAAGSFSGSGTDAVVR